MGETREFGLRVLPRYDCPRFIALKHKKKKERAGRRAPISLSRGRQYCVFHFIHHYFFSLSRSLQ